MKVKNIISSTIKVLAIVLTLAVLLPSAIKLVHAFNHHTHEVCESDNESNTHFHKSDIDCDFYKFKLTKNQFFALSKYNNTLVLPFLDKEANYYISFNKYQQSSKFLRGPPQLV